MGYVDIIRLLLEHGANYDKAIDILWKEEYYPAIVNLMTAQSLIEDDAMRSKVQS
jgi:hypothetical protein